MIKRFLATLALILSLASPAFAAVVYDSASGDDTGADADGDNTLNWTHTTAAGSNRALVIGCYSRVDEGSPTVTVDGAAATLHQSNTAGSDGLATLWYKIGQAIGSNTMVATFPDAPDATDNHVCNSLSFAGVHQTTPLGTAVTANTTGATSLSVNLVIASGELGVDIIGRRTGEALTVGSGQDQRTNRCTSATTMICSGMSTSPTVGTEAMNWTWTSSLVAHTIAAAVKAASSVIPTKPVFLD